MNNGSQGPATKETPLDFPCKCVCHKVGLEGFQCCPCTIKLQAGLPCAKCGRSLQGHYCYFNSPENSTFSFKTAEPQTCQAPARPASSQGPAREETPRIYAASRASVPARPVMWKQLRSEGFDIISSWIDEAEPGATGDLGELWERIYREIASADGLVLYVEADDFPLKGALVEAGIALGMGKPVHVVSPDLEFSAPSYRPIGSWITHPSITRFKNLQQACKAKFDAGAKSVVAAPQLEKNMNLTCGHKLADRRCSAPIVADSSSYSGYSHAHTADWMHWATPVHFDSGLAETNSIFVPCSVCGKLGPDNEEHVRYDGHKFITAGAAALPSPKNADVLNRLIEGQRLEFVRLRDMFSEDGLNLLAGRIQSGLSDGGSLAQEHRDIMRVLVAYFKDAQPRELPSPPIPSKEPK